MDERRTSSLVRAARGTPIALLALLACLAPGPAAARSTQGCRPLRAILYTNSDWLLLAKALAADPSPCAQYYISVPPPTSAKTQVRGGVAPAIDALGANFHTLAEVNVTAWQSWVASTGNSWYAAGVLARSEMVAAGFNVAAGDSWAVNELSSGVRQNGGASRQNIEQLLQGLYAGDGSAPTKGVVFAEGVGQSTTPLAPYKAALESWFQDTAFWSVVGATVSDFMQETYGDIRDYAVAGADVPTRLASLQAYLAHDLRLATVAPAGGAAAASVLEAGFGPLATAVWASTAGYGYTDVPADQMEDYVAAEVDAMRSYEAGLGWAGDRIGFAWAPANIQGLSASGFASAVATIAGGLANAIAQSGDPASPGAGACAPPWCTTVVAGAAFTPRWNTFASWSPTAAAFASAPVTVLQGSPSGALSLALEIDGVVTALPVATTVTLTSSSPGGAFATAPGGPWTPSLTLTLPAGSTSAGFYLEDGDLGTPTVSASVGGETTTQVERVAPPPPAVATLTPSAAVVGGAVTIDGTSLASTSAVSFGGVPAAFSVNSDSELVANVPAGASSGPVTVTTAGGTATSPAVFTVLPSIAGVSPGSGPAGTAVTLTGGGLAGASAVSFDGVPAVIGADAAGSLTTTVPSGAASGPIMVTTAAGTATSTTSFVVSPLALAGGGNTVSASTDGQPVTLDAALTPSDPGSATLSSATVTLSAGLAPGDTLSTVTTGMAITASYASGVLTLSGADSLANYQDVLRAVSFSSSGPPGARTITWTISDPTAASAQATTTIDVLAPPTAPTGVSAVAGDQQALVRFSAPPSSGGGAATSTYTVTSSPGGLAASGLSSPLTVTGLTDGTRYTFTVTATSAAGTSAASTASAAVTPLPASVLRLALNPTAQAVEPGGSATWTVTVAVSGAAPVAARTVDLLAPACATPSTIARALAALSDRHDVTYTCTRRGVTASFVNEVDATAQSALDGQLDARARARVTVLPPPVVLIAARLSARARGATLLLTLRLSKPARLALSLLGPRGKALASWHPRAGAGSVRLALALPPGVRQLGVDRLRLGVSGTLEAPIVPLPAAL